MSELIGFPAVNANSSASRVLFHVPRCKPRKIVLTACIAAGLSAEFSADAVLVGRWIGDAYTGGDWIDSSGNGHTGTVVGSPMATPGAFNGHSGVTLGGTSYFTVLNDAATLVGAEALTLVAVFKPTAANASSGGQFWQKAGLIGNEQAGAVNDWGLGFGASQADMGVGAPDTTILSGNLTLNTTHIAIGTWSTAGTMTLYVDGTQVAQNVSSPTAPRDANAFGTFGLGANLGIANGDLKPFIGQIAELRAYNDVDQDVTALTNSLIATYVPEPGSATLILFGGLALFRRRARRNAL